MITAITTVPADGQDAEDFPEPATDTDGNLIITARTVDLVTDIPPWLSDRAEEHPTTKHAIA